MKNRQTMLVGIFFSILCAIAVGISIKNISKTAPVLSDAFTYPTIIIDPGHGGVINSTIPFLMQ